MAVRSGKIAPITRGGASGPPPGPAAPLLRELQTVGDLGDGGRAPELVGELPGGVRDRHRSLLEASGEADLPDPVAEVAAKLAEDRGRGVGDKRAPALGVVAVERLHQAE